MKERLLKKILFIYLLSLVLGSAFAAEDKNDCSIGICHYELIENNNIDKFADILSALNKSADGDKTVEIKNLNQCKQLSQKQFEHMFFNGNPKAGKQEIDNDGSLSIFFKPLKLAIINKDYIIREVSISVQYPPGLFKAASSPKSTLFTLVQDKKNCELKQMIKGNPFTINKSY